MLLHNNTNVNIQPTPGSGQQSIQWAKKHIEYYQKNITKNSNSDMIKENFLI